MTDACDRVTAAQRVMRYVCHELRNPLHGLMVRDAVFRVSGVSLTFSLWQGVLEGVHADVAECTRCRATVDDLETIRDTGSNMAVILNDVLDLGQVGTLVPMCMWLCSARHVTRCYPCACTRSFNAEK